MGASAARAACLAPFTLHSMMVYPDCSSAITTPTNWGAVQGNVAWLWKPTETVLQGSKVLALGQPVAAKLVGVVPPHEAALSAAQELGVRVTEAQRGKHWLEPSHALLWLRHLLQKAELLQAPHGRSIAGC